jgi:hypothetical protein
MRPIELRVTEGDRKFPGTVGRFQPVVEKQEGSVLFIRYFEDLDLEKIAPINRQNSRDDVPEFFSTLDDGQRFGEKDQDGSDLPRASLTARHLVGWVTLYQHPLKVRFGLGFFFAIVLAIAGFVGILVLLWRVGATADPPRKKVAIDGAEAGKAGSVI